MNSTQRERCEKVAEYVIETGSTVRAAATHFGISKRKILNFKALRSSRE